MVVTVHCPYCGSVVNKVVDKRSVQGSGEIRRRRECLKCSRRYTTYERLAVLELVVIKRDGHKEAFDRYKLLNGITKALQKRPGADQAELIADKIEKKIRVKGTGSVTTKAIGKAVLVELRKVDKVAYLRFASVYRHFEDPRDFARELEMLEVLPA